jgi:ATP-dependent Clp protease, protease subunit
MDDINFILPKSVDTLALPSPDLIEYYKGIDNREIWIEDDVTEYTLDIVKKILGWNREDKNLEPSKRKPIKIFFFSNGGDLDVNNSIIDTIKLSLTPIWGINVGRCMSAAAFIYLSCHKRFMMEKSYFLFHQGSGAFSGTFSEVCAQIEDYQTQVEALTAFMLEHTTYQEEELSEKIVGEWFVRKEEALKNGVCDKILDSLDELWEIEE